jgi:hypothetical protein
MIDERNARLRAHANNIRRYERLLETRLSDVERRFIERRLAEERSALEALSAGELPAALTMPMREPATAALIILD